MKQETGKIQMAKLARIKHRQAELHDQLAVVLLEEAKIYDALAEGETVDLRTGKLRPKYQLPRAPENVTTEERAAAVQMLRDNELKRRSAR